MIEYRFLRVTIWYIVIISLIFSTLSFFRIPYQIYLWEIFIDGKLIFVILFLIYLIRKAKFQFNSYTLKLKSSLWKPALIWFVYPIGVYSIVVLIGVMVKEGKLENLDNITTLMLATLFDIPALFFFSLFFIMIEEIIFRGILLNSLILQHGKVGSAVIASIVFSIFCMADVFTNDFASIAIFVILIFFFFAVGILTSALAMKYNSLWVSYSFRIGLVTMTPLIITSYLTESDSFFRTKNSLFYAEGIFFSIITAIIGFAILRAHKNNKELQNLEKSTI